MASRFCATAILVLLAGACALQVPSVLDRFESVLASEHSATEALRKWCERRHIADTAVIAAHPARSSPVAASAGTRELLDVTEADPVGFRHVELSCGGVMMSRARNWYVPSRLTERMNRTLETTGEPFGTVVRPLGFSRHRLESRRGAADWCPVGTILSHRAVLILPDGRPISLVAECYTRANLETAG